MKNVRKRVKGLLVVLCAALLSASIALSADRALQKYASIETEEELMDKLRKLSVEELVSEMDILAINGHGMQSMIYHAAALSDKIDEVEYVEILGYAESSKLHNDTKAVLLQLAREKGRIEAISQTLRLKYESFAKNTKNDGALRVYALLALPENDNTNQILEGIAANDPNEYVAYQALHYLRSATNGQDMAYGVANEILSIGVKDERMLAAI